MNKICYLLLLLVLSVIFACGKNTTEPPTANELLQARVTALVDSMWQNYLTQNDLDAGGVLFYAQRGDNMYFSKANLAGNIGKNSLFRAASIAKTFTASAIMLMQQRGELNIDDCITATIPGKDTAYLPDSPDYDIPFKGQISLRQLLEHRAGVFDLSNFEIPATVDAPYAGMNWLNYVEQQDPGHFFTVDEMIGILAQHQLYHNEPGAAHQYSNTGYILLGKIIERVSGMSYEDYVKSEILEPNGLAATSFPLDVAQHLSNPRIPGMIYLPEGAIDIDLYNMSFEFAQGNLVTNAADLLYWLRKWQTGTAGLDLSTVLEMRESDYPDQNYGLGTSFSPGFGYGHTGAIAGCITLMYYDPDTDFAFVLLSNMWNMKSDASFDDHAYTLFDIAAKAKKLITAENPGTGSPVSEQGGGRAAKRDISAQYGR